MTQLSCETFHIYSCFIGKCNIWLCLKLPDFSILNIALNMNHDESWLATIRWSVAQSTARSWNSFRACEGDFCEIVNGISNTGFWISVKYINTDTGNCLIKIHIMHHWTMYRYHAHSIYMYTICLMLFCLYWKDKFSSHHCNQYHPVWMKLSYGYHYWMRDILWPILP